MPRPELVLEYDVTLGEFGFVIFAMLKRVDELPSPVITAYTESSISNGVTVRGLWIVIAPDGEGSKISINPDGGPFCVLDCAVASCII